MQATATDLRWGSRVYSGFEEYFPGRLDNLMIWNRVLYQSEVMQLYTDPFCFMQPLPLWRMDYVAAVGGRGLFRVPTLSGLGSGGSFFTDPVGGP